MKNPVTKMIQSGTDTEKVLETKEDTTTTTVIVAKDADVQKYTDSIKEILSEINGGVDFLIEVDETIIGGVIVKGNNTIVDRSYKTALTNLYRSITT